MAIAAVDILRRRGRTVELELAGTVYPGNEAYEERLRRDVREHGLEDLVTFSGYVAPSAAVFDRSDVALSLSTRDALGNVVVEAQLAERPVVAAGVGGHLESIVDGETGLHVPPGDPDAVADAVESLLADPARARQIALAGRESARELFGVRRYGDRVVALRARAGGRAPAAADSSAGLNLDPVATPFGATAPAVVVTGGRGAGPSRRPSVTAAAGRPTRRRR